MDSIEKTENNLLIESCSPSNAADLGEKVAQLDQVLTEEEKSFTELITKLIQTFNQTEFDVNNSEYAMLTKSIDLNCVGKSNWLKKQRF